MPRMKTTAPSRAGLITLAAAIGAAATAVWVESRARRAERERPPLGQFIDIDGVRLHYVERGDGPPVVLLHGNTVSHADFEASGLLDRLAKTHRVIAFDRPGYGYSDRPRDRLWTPPAQAALFHAALAQLGIERAVVVGHSMGTLTALAMALDEPSRVASLVLLGGYYYPQLRIDALLTIPVALPVLGDVMRYTVTALAGRLMLKGMVKGLFSPRATPANFFSLLSREMMLRPVQLRANAEDAAFMMSAAKALSPRYQELRMPVAIFAGADDMVVNFEAHSTRLHEELAKSKLYVVAGTGHMVHYVAVEQIIALVSKPDDATGINRSAMTMSNGTVHHPLPEAVQRL